MSRDETSQPPAPEIPIRDGASPRGGPGATDEPDGLRPGERAIPAAATVDAGLRFIGRIRSAHRSRADCPKNVREARERGDGAVVEIDGPWREALSGLETGEFVFLLTFLDQARRDLVLQAPRHAAGPRGTFSLRSPVRPNPIGLHLVRVTNLDAAAGLMGIDAIDVLDGTPLLDIKPYLPSVDAPPADEGGARP